MSALEPWIPQTEGYFIHLNFTSHHSLSRSPSNNRSVLGQADGQRAGKSALFEHLAQMRPQLLVQRPTALRDEVTVILTIEPDGTGTQNAMLSVRDTGIGIEPAMLAQVFDTFAQADRSLDRSRGGAGIGTGVG